MNFESFAWENFPKGNDGRLLLRSPRSFMEDGALICQMMSFPKKSGANWSASPINQAIATAIATASFIGCCDAALAYVLIRILKSRQVNSGRAYPLLPRSTGGGAPSQRWATVPGSGLYQPGSR
jgi:hypothetical protein